ncbi:DUF4270 family protein [Solitalea lacus]|uniref:DUF4270 family protein n=1 Tax=Solitalea lacus TaxID=2911172 RepID=UPI001EDB475E|nr:DUF4270 family protein [Solitalea lacus]UKJ07567.1 DUF4270 domain-containing protein [Solitalea lacus]
MKLIKLDLLILLISLFIFSGCENPDGIGLDNTDYQNGKQIDTFTVQTQLVADPKVRTDNKFTYNGLSTPNLFNKLLGYMNDDVFGKSYAEINSQLVRPDTSVFKFPAESTLDSAVLTLAYKDTSALANTFYGSATSKLKVVVEELSDPLRVDTSYYSDHFFNVKNIFVGGGFFTPNPKTKVKIMDFIKGKPDTLKAVAGHIRIPIDKNYAITKFIEAPNGVYDNAAKFNEYMKGLKIRIDAGQTTGSGGAVYLNVSNSELSALSLYYHKVGGDTTVRSLKLSGSVAQTNYFKHDYAGSIIETLLSGGTNNQQFAYVQAMAGVKTKVKFPYIKQLVKDNKKAINKAELVITIDPGTTGTFTTPARIILNKGLDNAGSYIQIADLSVADHRMSPPAAGLSGLYNTSKKTYAVLVTKYIQDILDGKETDDNLFLTFDNPAASAERAVLGGPKGPSYSMKLRIIYSDNK